METLLQDLRYAIRMLIKLPGFTAVAVLTLALGIGANAAIFSVVNTVLLAPLPYKQPDRLVMVWGINPQKGFDISPVSGGNFATWQAENHVFEQMAGSSDELYTLTGAGDPEQIIGYDFSADYFHVLGVAPELGRTFSAEEDRPGGPRVVVLSGPLWRRKFGADPKILGKAITLSGNPYTVIGVMPSAFRYPQLVELWTPMQLPAKYANDYQQQFLRVIARLKSGVTLRQAQSEMDVIARRIAHQHPDTNTGEGVKLVSLRGMLAGDIRTPLLVLLGAVGFVLLIACANVANLLLARAAGRQKETAIRTALGARRGRLIRQFLTESVLLSLVGGGLGLLLAVWSTNFLLAIFPNNIANLSIPRVEAIPVDGRVLGFSLLLAVLTGIVFGLAPALRATHTELSETLKETGRSSTSSGRERRRGSLLVVTEITLALVLLVGAGLLIKSFMRLTQGDLGLNPDHVLTMTLFLSPPHYPFDKPEMREQLVEKVIERTQALPGVQSAAAINFLPLSGFWNATTVGVEGRPQPRPGDELTADSRVVTPDYFRTMGIPLLKGRDFNAQDRKGAPQVVIISATLAHRAWGNDDPIGKRLDLGEPGKPNWWEIVGVVGDVKSFGLAEKTHADVYQPFAQIPYPLVAFTVRTASDPMALAPAVRNALWAIDREEPIFQMVSMKQLAGESIALRRVSMLLLVGFSVLALLLAAIGIYGVMAYSVAQRTHEIGIRVALGAQQGDVLRMVVGQGMRLAVAGVGLGLAAALALTRLMASLLYGVKATDPVTFIAVALLLAAAALLACYMPARRAMRVDPMVALRYE